MMKLFFSYNTKRRTHFDIHSCAGSPEIYDPIRLQQKHSQHSYKFPKTIAINIAYTCNAIKYCVLWNRSYLNILPNKKERKNFTALTLIVMINLFWTLSLDAVTSVLCCRICQFFFVTQTIGVSVIESSLNGTIIFFYVEVPHMSQFTSSSSIKNRLKKFPILK